MSRRLFVAIVATTLTITVFPVFQANAQVTPPTWNEISSATGGLPVPPGGPQQTSLAAGDLDNDGDQDLVLASRGGDNSLVIYRQSASSWDIFTVESEGLGIEAGGKVYDVDNDGWADIVMAGDFKSNKIWWWKNPGSGSWGSDWQRFTIKNSGGVKHHDLGFGDFDSDGTIEIAYWNQGTKGSLNDLHIGDVPANPTAVSHWPTTVVIDASATSEGMAIADVDRDGDEDLIAGGRLITDGPGNTLSVSVVNGAEAAYQWAAGDLIAGGHLELVASSGDSVGGLAYYSWNGSSWVRTDLLGPRLTGPWEHGHSVEIGDVNGDGHDDIFSAEMTLEAGAEARSVVLHGDGVGGFQVETVSTGVDNHESILVDLDNDGDLDIASKPFNQSTPALRMFMNSSGPRTIGPWTRHHIATRSTRAAWVRHGDINRDGLPDLISGNAWHENPGSIDGVWQEHKFGSRLTNTIEVLDLDGDGDLDVFGSGRLGRGIFAWAENHGNGSFTTHANIPNGAPDFVQGVAVLHTPTGIEIHIAWNNRKYGIDKVVVPSNPSATTWSIQDTSFPSMGEAFDFVDVDADGDLDLLQGHMWSRNDGAGSYTDFTFYSPTRCCFEGSPGADDRLPDRIVAADMNQDGRIDVVATHENDLSKSLAWYEQPADPTQSWTRHTLLEANYPLHSLDVADIDGDGDPDIVTAEHDSDGDNNGRTLLLENLSGNGLEWRHTVIHDGESNHDGTQFADLDGDGDLDIYTIGWRHDRVVIHENLSAASTAAPPIWHDTVRRYRVDLANTSGPVGAFERPAVTAVNLTQALSAAGGSGSADRTTMRVIEVNEAGDMIDGAVPFQFDSDPGFSASNASGELVVLMAGTTAPSTTRHYQLYFDVIGSVATPVVIPPRITTTPGVIDEGATATRVDTPNGIWFYDMDGGGFISLVDSAGNDWIGYSTAEKAAGEFRGVPNLVTPNDGGYFHPGRVNAASVLRSSGPLRTTIDTEIPGTDWAMTWHIYAEYATGTVTSNASTYYFQYEGVPGGSLGPEDVVHRAGATIGAFDSFEADLSNPEWMAASDTVVGRSLMITNDSEDNITDSYRDHQDLMTVMVFGRPNGPATSLLSDIGTTFTIELVEGATLPAAQSAADTRTGAPTSHIVRMISETGTGGPGNTPPPSTRPHLEPIFTIPISVESAHRYSFGQTAPSGWDLADGSLFAGSWGWIVPDGKTRQCGERDTSADQVHDNFCHATTQYVKVDGKWQHNHSPASWKAALANGSYDVTVTVGEATHHPSAVAHSVQVEGVSVHDRAKTTKKDPFKTASVTVEVTDGSLDLTFIGGTKTKVVSVEILPVARGAVEDDPIVVEPISAPGTTTPGTTTPDDAVPSTSTIPSSSGQESPSEASEPAAVATSTPDETTTPPTAEAQFTPLWILGSAGAAEGWKTRYVNALGELVADWTGHVDQTQSS